MRVPASRSAARTALVLALPLLAGAAEAVNVRVIVASGPTVRIRVPISTTPTGLPLATTPAAPTSYAEWQVGVSGARLTLDGQDSGSASLYLPPAPGSLVGIGGADYRGGVLLRVNSGRVDAINVLDVEDYLRGVVPAEMPASWPLEALKAQAIIARTYAVARLNPAAPYDLCATEQCQVYGGLARENPATDVAIQQTGAQVVSFGGKLAKTFFSSDSGGFTASAGEVWGNDLPYLVAQPDPASRSPKSAWTVAQPLTKVAEVAGRYGVRVGTVTNVALTRVSASGRALEVTVTGTGGTARIGGAEAGGFVRALGAFSSRVVISGQDPVVISGAGYGHGVGLSQWGAAGLAAGAWNSSQILGFYYPGAALSALQESAATPQGSAAALFATRPLPRSTPQDVMAALGGVGAE
ncbi:SpoIID/LytB domain-containing protein [Deinococcus pimensis]|uniref:SpoIID/LytB domain-containing protein n=1 Tax=Deinococcus pimensis TaxID=309888 RepID=UPI0005EBEE3A|nr:SpoIID/LytB domain-containing protein [Deinococcus pimensis]